MQRLKDDEWELLIERIKIERCTPFLGAGASAEVLPLGGTISSEWAKHYNFPLENYFDLSAVAQFMALQRDPMFPKDEIVKMFDQAPTPNYDDLTEPHMVLAGLPLPIYITTNYDDFMYRALKRRRRDARRELCRWNALTKRMESLFDSGYRPSVSDPVVFHLHGYTHTYVDKERVAVPESLVLTEDDYFDFLINLTTDPDLIPGRIQKALSDTTLLFVGYRLADINFRVLLRSLSRFIEQSQARIHFAIMQPPSRPNRNQSGAGRVADGEETAEESEQLARVKDYLTTYYRTINVKVYWGTAKDFARELKERL